ncbi:hypothetical protein F5B20DRAFT_561590 [Whalleya microplaca]|nr:hypothetical protein F5B20DRAFT_561590 [Whalleya microplaca]
MEIWKFQAAAPRRQHLESRLPREFFRCQTDQSQATYRLTVKKLCNEFPEDMKQYNQKLRLFQNEVRPFQGKYVEALLGEVRYRKLVLNNLAGGEGTIPRDHPRQKKRKAEEELDGSSASRPKIIE